MSSKYGLWIHTVSNRRYIVAQRREDGRWYSKNTEDDPGKHEVIGASPLDLVAKKIRTYANWNAAVKAFRRLYGELADLPENSVRKENR